MHQFAAPQFFLTPLRQATKVIGFTAQKQSGCSTRVRMLLPSRLGLFVGAKEIRKDQTVGLLLAVG